REPAVVGDADLDLGAAVVAEQPCAGCAVRPRQHLDAAAGEADARAVETLDHGLLGGPPAGQALVVAGAVRQLGRCVDLVEAAATGAPDRKRDSINRDCVDADPLHLPIIRRSPTWRGCGAGRRPAPA